MATIDEVIARAMERRAKTASISIFPLLMMKPHLCRIWCTLQSNIAGRRNAEKGTPPHGRGSVCRGPSSERLRVSGARLRPGGSGEQAKAGQHHRVGLRLGHRADELDLVHEHPRVAIAESHLH